MHIPNGTPPSLTAEHIWLDMDGVLCDLHKAVLAIHGRMDLLPNIGNNNIEAKLNMNTMQVWAPIVAAGWEWWNDLEPFPWTFELWDWAYNSCERLGVITRPLLVNDPQCRDIGHTVRGKSTWLRRHFGGGFTNIIFTPNKAAISQPGVFLIDDDEGYEASFNAGGGHQIVFPRPYNRYRQFADDPMVSVHAQYEEAHKRQ